MRQSYFGRNIFGTPSIQDVEYSTSCSDSTILYVNDYDYLPRPVPAPSLLPMAYDAVCKAPTPFEDLAVYRYSD